MKQKSTGTTVEPVERQPTYKEIGVTKKEASEAQILAGLPKEEKEKVVKGKKKE